VNEPDWDGACALLRGARTVLVACHVDPDGDALGSALALGLALRGRGTRVTVSFGTADGAGVPSTLAFLPGQELLARPDEVFARRDAGAVPDVLVTTDTGSRDRLGPLAPLVDEVPATLVVDHHASNTRFGTHLLLDVGAASTTVLVEHLLARLGIALDSAIATCLYVGLVTDTGQFQFSATTPSVHALAGRLLAAGVRPDEVGREVFGSVPFAAVRLQGLAVSRVVLEPGLVWTWVGHEEREAAGLPLAAVEGVIDAVRVAVEAEVALVAKGVAPGEWAVSTRSRGTVDVGALCVGLGGGGHRFAAGATLHGSLDDVVGRVRGALQGAGDAAVSVAR